MVQPMLKTTPDTVALIPQLYSSPFSYSTGTKMLLHTYMLFTSILYIYIYIINPFVNSEELASYKNFI